MHLRQCIYTVYNLERVSEDVKALVLVTERLFSNSRTPKKRTLAVDKWNVKQRESENMEYCEYG